MEKRQVGQWAPCLTSFAHLLVVLGHWLVAAQPVPGCTARASAPCWEHIGNLFLSPWVSVSSKCVWKKTSYIKWWKKPLLSQSPSCWEKGINIENLWEFGSARMVNRSDRQAGHATTGRMCEAGWSTSYQSVIRLLFFWIHYFVSQAKHSIFLNVFPPIPLII